MAKVENYESPKYHGRGRFSYKNKFLIFVNNSCSVFINTKLLKEVSVMKKNNYSKEEPTMAEGMDTEDELNRSATQEEIDNGDSTKVTILSLDENDPS